MVRPASQAASPAQVETVVALVVKPASQALQQAEAHLAEVVALAEALVEVVIR